MNRIIQTEVIREFKATSHPYILTSFFVNDTARKLGVSPEEIVKELRLMKDDEILEEGDDRWRLKRQGERASASLKEKVSTYLSTHWEALIAILLSLFALLKP